MTAKLNNCSRKQKGPCLLWIGLAAASSFISILVSTRDAQSSIISQPLPFFMGLLLYAILWSPLLWLINTAERLFTASRKYVFGIVALGLLPSLMLFVIPLIQLPKESSFGLGIGLGMAVIACSGWMVIINVVLLLGSAWRRRALKK